MGNMEEKKESQDPFTHTEDGGRYRMAGFRNGHYYYKCDKCDKEVVISYISDKKEKI